MRFKEQNEELIEYLTSHGILKTPCIIQAFRKIMRHNFVPKDYLDSAYEDVPLPLTNNVRGPTISQPLTVASMLEALQPKEGEKILDVGTGSGWQACLLAYCVGKDGNAVTIDIDKRMYDLAKENIDKTGLNNILVVLGDGSEGYEKEAPYDKIIVSAAAPKLPEPLKKQVTPGGRIVAPIGGMFNQQVIVFDKISDNEFKESSLGWFIFVSLQGKYGYK
jgi:protein-L-isoaspartate(D-aspartate) O-methyltransferase